MGTWGTGVFDDDESSDVRARHRDLVSTGSTSEEATRQTLAPPADLGVSLDVSS
jgi:hypothetical protein